jgi:formate dehydrogenase major subunit
VTYELLEEKGSVQWPCNEAKPDGTPVMHVDGFVRGKGKFIRTEYVATDERTGPRFPLLADHRPDPQPVQCRRADPAHGQRRLARRGPCSRSIPMTPNSAASARAIWSSSPAARARPPARHHHRTRCARRGLHHLPPPGTQANVITTDFTDWATNCPEYKVTAVQVSPSNGPTAWQQDYEAQATQSRRIAREDALEPAE